MIRLPGACAGLTQNKICALLRVRSDLLQFSLSAVFQGTLIFMPEIHSEGKGIEEASARTAVFGAGH